jgi:hypothetical protein
MCWPCSCDPSLLNGIKIELLQTVITSSTSLFELSYIDFVEKNAVVGFASLVRMCVDCVLCSHL